MHFSTHALQNLLDAIGYPAVLLFVAIESTGIPFPGETMLIVAAVYAGTHHTLSIFWVITFAAIGAILGDNAGYIVGRTGGRAVALRYGRYVRLDESKLKVAERFFQKHGDKTVFFGRFVAVLRAWAAFLAGVNDMPWHRFVIFNAAGGIVWSTLYGILAFKLGENLPLLDKIVRAMGIAGVALAVLVVLGALAFHYRRRLPFLRDRFPAQEATDADAPSH